ncbi:MAG TPA: hypothetical protein VL832_00535 [Puia sp.]|nr:hypothetical protein [Puia sp.]
MMKRTIAPLSGAAFLFALILFIHGCKKQDQNSLVAQKDEQARAKEAIKNQIDQNGRTWEIPVHQQLEAFYADAKGNRVPRDILLQHSRGSQGGKTTDAITSACDFSNEPSATITAYSLNSNCITGTYIISWTYLVSSNNNIAAANPASPSATSKGLLKIYNSSGVQQYTQNATTVSIVDNGIDSVNSGYELFSVTFTSTAIASSYFNTSNVMKLGATIVTDCPDVEAFSISITPYSFNTYGGPLASSCDRIDPIWFASTTNPFKIWGEDPTATCQSGFVYPHMQQIEYLVDTSKVWVDSASATLGYYLPPPPGGGSFDNYLNAHRGYVDPYGFLELKIDFSSLPSGSHTIYFRHRNITFNTVPTGEIPLPTFGAGGNCCVGAWSSIVSYTFTH